MITYDCIVKPKLYTIFKRAFVVLLVSVLGCALTIALCRTMYNFPAEHKVVQPADDNLLVRAVVALEKLVVIEENE